MASLPSLTIIENSHVAPPHATIGDHKSLPLTFFDIFWLNFIPVHTLFFYDIPLITKTHFTQTIIPNLKQSLSVTLQHFFPFVGKLILFPSNPTKMPEIRYVEGDSVTVTFAECNLDFNDLSGNHPRKCDKFYPLIPLLGSTNKVNDYISIPVFAVQVTLFPNHGISIGMTNHHSLCDASTRFCFMKAWTSIARSGGLNDQPLLDNGITLPSYERVVQYPNLDQSYLKAAKVENFKEYQLPRLSGPSDKVRVSFKLTRTMLNELKQIVSTQLPTLKYVSAFTVACAYIWNCMVKLHNKDELALFVFAIDCRSRMDPPIPASYFGNCLTSCMTTTRTDLINGNEGFVMAAKLIGESLNKILTDKNGVVKDIVPFAELFPDGMPTMKMGVTGNPKLRFYDLDFGFGKPKKHETVSIDYQYGSISMSASKESNEDLEIGMSLLANEVDAFVRIFNEGLEAYI
ncbi:HXXXD-type acyl-transferase family protein [Artemisia annua]|uniref:HXXXD-type acyl-transferase family protein n=1 Tax=Artemisia annua TaxID=35608 RepID=A0A2U1NMZ6_ARTAN|nr:HXXXD-type acyl-transferase family protein [Artemisia annua]